jgi:hypothetical protein
VLAREHGHLVLIHFGFLTMSKCQAGADSLAPCGLRQRVFQECQLGAQAAVRSDIEQFRPSEHAEEKLRDQRQRLSDRAALAGIQFSYDVNCR